MGMHTASVPLFPALTHPQDTPHVFGKAINSLCLAERTSIDNILPM